MLKSVLAAAALLLVSAGSAAAQTTPSYAWPQHDRAPQQFWMVVEIPAGSFTKYEIDAETGHVIVDRFQSMPVAYPANYGSITSSAAADGDLLDALVITREPIVPGALIRVRAIGVLRMLDGGEQDDKIIAVPVSGVDPTYDDIRSIEDLPEIERQRILAFFLVYKDLPEGRRQVELQGFGAEAEATQMVGTAIEAYRRREG